VIVGNPLTVTTAVIIQPLLLVYVIVVVPTLTPVTCPELSIVATAVSDDTQGVVVAAVPDPVNCVVKPSQTFKVPVILGKALTVTTAVIEHASVLV